MKNRHVTAISLSLLLVGAAQATDVSGNRSPNNIAPVAPVESVTPVQPRAADKPPSIAPPPGQCRIWYHGKPPAQQPAPGDCKKLRKKIPPGATLIRG